MAMNKQMGDFLEGKFPAFCHTHLLASMLFQCQAVPPWMHRHTTQAVGALVLRQLAGCSRPTSSQPAVRSGPAWPYPLLAAWDSTAQTGAGSKLKHKARGCLDHAYVC